MEWRGQVAITDRQHKLANGVAAEICRSGVRDHDAFASLAQSIVERSGRIDYFFNNAGITVGGPIEDYFIKD